MKLTVDDGTYESETLAGLILEVLRHRFWHWRNGDGWRD